MNKTNTAHLALLIEARERARTGQARSIRESAGLSQGDIARAAEINAATVSRWESRQRRPTGDAAIRWACVLRLIGKTKVDT